MARKWILLWLPMALAALAVVALSNSPPQARPAEQSAGTDAADAGAEPNPLPHMDAQPFAVTKLDPLFRRTGAVNAAVDLPEQAAAERPVDIVLSSVNNDKMVYDAPLPFTLRLESGGLTLNLKEGVLATSDWKANLGKETLPATFSLNSGKIESVSTTSLPPGTHTLQLRLVDDKGKVKGESSVFRAVVPNRDTPPLIVDRVSNNKYSAGKPPNGALSVYNRYLRMEGRSVNFGDSIEFGLFNSTNVHIAEGSVNPVLDGKGGWTAELRLPDMPKVEAHKLRLWLVRGGSYSVPFKPIEVTPASSSRLPAPTITAVGDATKTNGVYRLKTPNVDITATAEKGADRQLLLFVEPGPSPRDVRPIDDSDKSPQKVTFPVTLRDGVTYRVSASLVEGDFVGERSAAETVVVNTTGPRVVGVRPLDFGTTPGLYAVTVYFDQDHKLDPAKAETAANFELYDGKGENKQNPKAKPAYDAIANSVTLNFPPLKPDVYKFVVAKAIEDVFGNPLEGTPGTPGTDYSTSLVNPIGGDLPSRSEGITGTSGPYVAFPEYTRPREVPDGANPSDKVETRVARLYYYRDAHRVAQIINRDVKSYNYHAVAVRRRMADKARDEANKDTDERRAQERRAVRAAQEARAAEKALEAAQNALTQARQGGEQSAQTVQTLDGQIAQTEQQANVAAERRSLWQTELDRRRLAAKPDATEVREAEAAVDQTTAAGRTLDLRLADLRRQRAQASANLAAEAGNLQSAQRRIADIQAEIQAKRNEEVAEYEKALVSTAREDRAREEQFQREVAAAHEDPDTYAPGIPKSDDPVQQVSISVIGEGLIQLRGPLKGVNVIRTMINQIDSPVGQVRVAIHTMQVNGEHGDRMEKVVGRIQHYIDHSRFLTEQSGQMLRQSVTLVASRKAQEAALSCPPGSQEARDQKYLYNFFGKDFTDELMQLDSEFLKTGNKLLSLHSMDSTSLASALFLLALAKNSTRQEILVEFERRMTYSLPEAEQRYFVASSPPKDCKKFLLLAQNAAFQSLKGFFNNDVEGPDTINPVQREFIRLAQIFKNRLVVELEYKQRVLERTVIEERFVGNYKKLVLDQKNKEEYAERVLGFTQQKVNEQRVLVFQGFARLNARVRQLTDQALVAQELVNDILSERDRAARTIQRILPNHSQSLANDTSRKRRQFLSVRAHAELYQKVVAMDKQARNAYQPGLTQRDLDSLAPKITHKKDTVGIRLRDGVLYFESRADAETWDRWINDAATLGERLSVVNLSDSNYRRLRRTLDDLRQKNAVIDNRYPDNGIKNLMDFYGDIDDLLAETVLPLAAEVRRRSDRLTAALGQRESPVQRIYNEWIELREEIRSNVRDSLRKEAEEQFTDLDAAFNIILQLDLQLQFAQRDAAESRRPLDHKKLLDMFIDDVEDKYIELLEGTRAHTANIDNYIKQLSTALDDDFHTQYYYPAFREVRQASRMWDVSLGKIETTSILTNNRAFAKVSPQATMEFDLPKRDILIAEAMNGSLAMVDTYGALLQDPTFLALTKLRSGQPPASQVQGAGAGLSSVRSVLPGLPSSTEERVLSQDGPGRREFATPLEALIPDPAIYKFETGTGYEIRPVLSPDGQAVVFHFNYMYTTDVREPVRADEKHLGRVKRHFIDTDVQLSNYEMREISRYVVALKASRTSRGVPLLEDIPGIGILFRPLPSAESSLQENLIYGQAVVFPTLFDLMGLRWAPAVADLDPLRTVNQEFVTRARLRDLKNRTYDYSASRVDEFLRIPPADRRPDLYRTQETLPHVHPNGYSGPGLGLRDSTLQEGHDPRRAAPGTRFVPSASPEGTPFRRSAPGLPEGALPEFGHPPSPPPFEDHGPTLPPLGVPLTPTPGIPHGSLPPMVPGGQLPYTAPFPRPVPTPGAAPQARRP